MHRTARALRWPEKSQLYSTVLPASFSCSPRYGMLGKMGSYCTLGDGMRVGSISTVGFKPVFKIVYPSQTNLSTLVVTFTIRYTPV